LTTFIIVSVARWPDNAPVTTGYREG